MGVGPGGGLLAWRVPPGQHAANRFPRTSSIPPEELIVPPPPVPTPRRPSVLRRLLSIVPYVQLVAGVVIVIAGMHAAQIMLAPLALAVFVAGVSLPAMTWLRRRGAPTGVAILLVVLMNTLLLTFVGWVVVVTVNELRVELPAYLERAQAMEAAVGGWLNQHGVEVVPDVYATLVQPDTLLDTVTRAARNITSVLALFVLILLYVVFVLAESVVLPAKVRRVLGPRASALAGGAEVMAQVQRYLGLKTLISLATGSLVSAAAAAIGVDFALFWGLLSFLLNYVPTIGSLVASIPGILVALLQLGPGPALLFAACYLVINVAIGNIIDPILTGRQLRLSPLVVLVSLVFWGWTWGPIGAFLSVPLTISLRMVMERVESLRPIAAMMGPLDMKNVRPES